MRNYLQAFMESYDYPREAVNALLAAYDILGVDPAFQKLLSIYEADRFCDYPALLEACHRIADDTGIHTYTVEFLMFMCFSRKLRETYLEHGLPESLWRESMLDLKCKMQVCWEVKHIWGMFVAWWYDGFFRMERFGMGRLEFELFDFPREYYEKDGRVLRKGDKVINVHIAKTGQPLTPALLDISFRRAEEFYQEAFAGKPMPFFCESWLLYPKMYDFLPQGSNIRAFMDRFDIFYTHLYEKGDYGETWRLFDMDYTGTLEDFPADSSLRRGYRQYLMDGGRIGEGYGVFFR